MKFLAASRMAATFKLGCAADFASFMIFPIKSSVKNCASGERKA
jgi:hypothetical protein